MRCPSLCSFCMKTAIRYEGEKNMALAVTALLIAFSASVIGGICGIGGGIIIKPLLDLIGFASVSAVSFLSSCTVLCMALYNVGKSRLEHSRAVEAKTGLPLAVGAAVGGVAGSPVFRAVCRAIGSDRAAGAAQSILLFCLVLGTLLYTLHKKNIKPRVTDSAAVCVLIGFSLGLLSSFLGIGGGPFNLVVLHYFLGQETKRAVENSLFIILLSQIANLLMTLLTGSVPDVGLPALLLMAAGGIGGGIVGKEISKKLSGGIVDKLFSALLVLIMLICVYNAVKLLA